MNELYKRLDRPAREVYKELDENTRMLYCKERCDLCGAKLSTKQLNIIITEGVPPVCRKCHEELKGKMEELQVLFGQLRLF